MAASPNGSDASSRDDGAPPRRPADVFEALVALRARGRRCVLATVVRSAGSTPRKDAARMLISADEQGQPALVGTVGGGRVEKEVVDASLALLAEGTNAHARLLRYHLTRDLGMCCGGEMEVFVEPIVPEPPLVVCGSGHIARALVPLARSVGFAPTVIDEPMEGASAVEALPGAVATVESYAPADWGVPLDERAFVVILTRDHATDQRILESVIDREVAYLGLIGSRRKIAMFRERLLAKGVSAERFDRVRAPIGFDIGAETPEEIAVAIVGELIRVRAERRHGVMAGVALVLSAGASARMGSRPKALLAAGTLTFASRIASTARNAGLGRVIYVVGPPHGEEIRERLPPGCESAWNPDPSRGMLSSVHVGLAALGAVDGPLLIWPVDVPLPTAEAVMKLLAAADPLDRPAVPEYRGRGGHPLRIPAALIPPLRALPVEAGLRALLQDHPAVRVPVDDMGVIEDIDTPEDYRRRFGRMV